MSESGDSYNPDDDVTSGPLSAFKTGDRAEAAVNGNGKSKRPPYNPGFGGGWGQIYLLLIIGGAVGLGYTLDVDLPGPAAAEAATTGDKPQPANPEAKTDGSDYRPDFDPDDPFARPDPDAKKDGKGGSFFGIPTNE